MSIKTKKIEILVKYQILLTTPIFILKKKKPHYTITARPPHRGTAQARKPSPPTGP